MTETKTPMPDCPECEKLSAVSDESNKIGAFLDWMTSSKSLLLCTWEDNEDDDTNGYLPEILLPVREYRGDVGISRLLAEYFEIDLDKVEQERRVLLDWIREQQEGEE